MQTFEFSEIGITVAVIAGVMTFIVLTFNAVNAIHQWREMARKPQTDKIEDHERRIAHLEGCCTEVQSKLASDLYAFQRAEEMNRLMLKSIKQLIAHSLDGNNTSGLKQVEQEVDDYLLKHV